MMRKAVPPALARRTISATSLIRVGLTPATGSSSTTNRGADIIAPAKASSFFWP